MSHPTLNRLATDYLSLFGQAAPVAATMFGIPGHDDELPEISAEGQAEITRRMTALRDQVAAIDPAILHDVDRATRSLLIHECQSFVNAGTSAEVEWAVGLYAGPINLVLSAIPKVVLNNPDKVRDYQQRCAKLPAYLDQWVIRLRHGVGAGYVANRRTITVAIDQLDRHLASPFSDDPLLQPLRELGSYDLDLVAGRVIEGVRPALRRVRQTLHDDVLPAARPDDHCGVLHLPGGTAIYAAAVRQHTTTDQTAGQLHELGHRLLAGLRDELRELGERTFGISDLAQIQHRLRDDPQLRYRSATELVADATAALELAQQASPDWFQHTSPIPCDIGEMNAAEADTAVPGYYQPPADDGSRPGRFWINTGNPASRCRYETEALTFHEAVPGHHLQFAAARQLDGLPEFRRFAYVSAYGEGWGLYAERLADEMGIYSSDITRLGMVSFDALRACRLVVDTGMHAGGWSRDQAITFMEENTAIPFPTIATEVDRYINWPGQALAYMTGREEIRRLREHAQGELGQGFDLRQFHTTVLGHGSVPLTELRKLVQRAYRLAAAQGTHVDG